MPGVYKLLMVRMIEKSDEAANERIITTEDVEMHSVLTDLQVWVSKTLRYESPFMWQAHN